MLGPEDSLEDLPSLPRRRPPPASATALNRQGYAARDAGAAAQQQQQQRALRPPSRLQPPVARRAESRGALTAEDLAQREAGFNTMLSGANEERVNEHLRRLKQRSAVSAGARTRATSAPRSRRNWDAPRQSVELKAEQGVAAGARARSRATMQERAQVPRGAAGRAAAGAGAEAAPQQQLGQQRKRWDQPGQLAVRPGSVLPSREEVVSRAPTVATDGAPAADAADDTVDASEEDLPMMASAVFKDESFDVAGRPAAYEEDEFEDDTPKGEGAAVFNADDVSVLRASVTDLRATGALPDEIPDEVGEEIAEEVEDEAIEEMLPAAMSPEPRAALAVTAKAAPTAAAPSVAASVRDVQEIQEEEESFVQEDNSADVDEAFETEGIAEARTVSLSGRSPTPKRVLSATRKARPASSQPRVGSAKAASDVTSIRAALARENRRAASASRVAPHRRAGSGAAVAGASSENRQRVVASPDKLDSGSSGATKPRVHVPRLNPRPSGSAPPPGAAGSMLTPRGDALVSALQDRVHRLDASKQRSLFKLLEKLDRAQETGVDVSAVFEGALATRDLAAVSRAAWAEATPAPASAAPVAARRGDANEFQLAAQQQQERAVSSLSAGGRAPSPTAKAIYLVEVASTWGGGRAVGLTAVEVIDQFGRPLRSRSFAGGIGGALVPQLTNGQCRTTAAANMWLGRLGPPPSASEKAAFRKRLTIKVIVDVGEGRRPANMRLWNYNRSLMETAKGAKDVRVIDTKDQSVVWQGTVQKGCGNAQFDYSTTVRLDGKRIDPPAVGEKKASAATSGPARAAKKEAPGGARAKREAPTKASAAPAAVRNASSASGRGSASEPSKKEAEGEDNAATAAPGAKRPTLAMRRSEADAARERAVSARRRADQAKRRAREEDELERRARAARANREAAKAIEAAADGAAVPAWLPKSAPSPKAAPKSPKAAPKSPKAASKLTAPPGVSPNAASKRAPRAASAGRRAASKLSAEGEKPDKVRVQSASAASRRSRQVASGAESKPPAPAASMTPQKTGARKPRGKAAPDALNASLDSLQHFARTQAGRLSGAQAGQSVTEVVAEAAAPPEDDALSLLMSSPAAKPSDEPEPAPVDAKPVKRSLDLPAPAEGPPPEPAAPAPQTVVEHAAEVTASPVAPFAAEEPDADGEGSSALAAMAAAAVAAGEKGAVEDVDGSVAPEPIPETAAEEVSIPTEPRGRTLELVIHSTWGDQHYVGLAGMDIFDADGSLVQFEDAGAAVSAEPEDINVLSEYTDDPRTIDKLLDGVNATCDDMHVWLAPYTPGEVNRVRVELDESTALGCVRFFNYNKSRVHAARGARHVSLLLDGEVIFVGELNMAPGSAGEAMHCATSVVFTDADAALDAIEAHDVAIFAAMPDEGGELEGEDLQAALGEALEVVNEPQSGLSADGRPMTAAVRAPPPLVGGHVVTSPPAVLDVPTVDAAADAQPGAAPNGDGVLVGRVLRVELLSTWGDKYYVGLTEVELLDAEGNVISVPKENVRCVPADLNIIPGYNGDDRTADKLLDGTRVTEDDHHMWLAPWQYSGATEHFIEVTLPAPAAVKALRLWNYNKSVADTYRGAREVRLSLDGQDLGAHVVRKAPGCAGFDFGQRIELYPAPALLERTAKLDAELSAAQQRLAAGGKGSNHNNHVRQAYDTPLLPVGHVLCVELYGTHGDPFYVGLDGLEILNALGERVDMSRALASASASVRSLPGHGADARTADKLVDGVIGDRSGKHSWLAPAESKVEPPRAWVAFDEPVAIGAIRLWNYSKTPARGAAMVDVSLDGATLYQGFLREAPPAPAPLVPQTVLFSNDPALVERLAPEAHSVSEEQSVLLFNETKPCENTGTLLGKLAAARGTGIRPGTALR